MYAACTRKNLGDRGRATALRIGVLFVGAALIIALSSYELGVASTFGWLLALPVSLAAYALISGSWGVCAYHGVKGLRDTDHGPEVVLDRESRSRMRLRALLVVSASLVVGLAFAAAFVASV